VAGLVRDWGQITRSSGPGTRQEGADWRKRTCGGVMNGEGGGGSPRVQGVRAHKLKGQGNGKEGESKMNCGSVGWGCEETLLTEGVTGV